MIEYDIETIKDTILYFHGLNSSYRNTKISIDDIQRCMSRIGPIQIDTINVVERSHYLVIWSRLGNFNKNLLDKLIYEDKLFFEYWLHCASIIPKEVYPFRIYKMKEYKSNLSFDHKLYDDMLKFVKVNGAVKASTFKETNNKGGWWNWKPSKRILEDLYNTGDLMISKREKFQRCYDLRERVLPKVFQTQKEKTKEESITYLLEYAAKKMGVFYINDLSYYSFFKKKDCSEIIKMLIDEGKIIEIKVLNTYKNNKFKMYIHHETVNILNKITKFPKNTEVKILSPFDSFLWSKKRILDIFNFEQVLEAYKKPINRRWGYFSLPILYGNNLVGRLDPKMDRSTKTLIIKSIHFDKDFVVDQDFMEKISSTLLNFVNFNNGEKIDFLHKTKLSKYITEYVSKHLKGIS